MLQVSGIHKIYKSGKTTLRVLQGIDLEVRKGEALAVVGPSGAGKSTLLHILGGLDRPSEGKVLLEDVDFYKLPDKERARLRNQNIGFVFQFYHLLSEFNALENVLMPGLIRGVGCSSTSLGTGRVKEGEGVKKRARALLEEFGLKDRLYHRPGELSGGERQRVAIARALVNDPSILLCDEPTGNLDSNMGEGILRILFELNKKNNMTIVIVTHDREIAKSSGRVLEIKDGKLI